MSNFLSQSILSKSPRDAEEFANAVKEVIQETLLAALSKTDFFTKAAFYGGTASRILYGLPRFSEDLDFTLLQSDRYFDWHKYFPAIENHFALFGLKVELGQKEKIQETDTRSAFLKENEIETLKIILPDNADLQTRNHNQAIRIKFEIDVNPPAGFSCHHVPFFSPFYCDVNALDKESIFAGKIAAILTGKWKNMAKGRDLFDYLFFLSSKTKINMAFLESNLKKAGKIDGELTREHLRVLLTDRFSSINYQDAIDDVIPFIRDNSALQHWTKEYFLDTLDLLH